MLFKLAVDVQVAAEELYNSVVFVRSKFSLYIPPVTKTFPFGNTDAVCHNRVKNMFSSTVQVPFNGSYNSVELIGKKPSPVAPPVTKTIPFGNKDAS
jgi:hypothetical protein